MPLEPPVTSTRWPLSSPCPPSSWAASSRDALREGSSAPFDMIVYWINIYHANAASQPFERSEQGVASGLQAADQTQRRPLISPSLSDLEGGAAGSDLQHRAGQQAPADHRPRRRRQRLAEAHHQDIGGLRRTVAGRLRGEAPQQRVMERAGRHRRSP